MDRGGVIGREVRGHPEPQDVFGFDEDIDGKAHQTCLRHFVNLQFHPPHKIVHGGKAFGIGQLELTLVGEGVGAWLKDPFVRLSSFGLGNASISILLG